tara:strand:+ start:476 stop:718 length:243 start_codon:yes stop_codon:yes gene_type:complete
MRAIDSQEINETVTNLYHDQPRYIYSIEKRIDPAPVINHSYQELILLESLVGRIPPFFEHQMNEDREYNGYLEFYIIIFF